MKLDPIAVTQHTSSQRLSICAVMRVPSARTNDPYGDIPIYCAPPLGHDGPHSHPTGSPRPEALLTWPNQESERR